ncbi:MAG: DUF1571 domain-containing protein [Mariniblastus sp.]
MHQRLRSSFQMVLSLAIGVSVLGTQAMAQTDSVNQTKATESPTFRVPKTTQNKSSEVPKVATRLPNNNDANPKAAPAAPKHPLDRAVSIAEEALGRMRREVNDYTAILVKRQRINGELSPTTYMGAKIRCPRRDESGVETPFSIYMRFMKPAKVAGREVIWVDGKDDNKAWVHEGAGAPLLRLKSFLLEPTSTLMMRGQREPVYEAGLENLIIKLIEKAERDRAAGMCVVNYSDGATINKRSCSVIELIHEDQRAPYEFYKAQVFIDDELGLPIRFAAYDWPSAPGEAPELIEEYTYVNIKVNVGLKDSDFDPRNPTYKFKGLPN